MSVDSLPAAAIPDDLMTVDPKGWPVLNRRDYPVFATKVKGDPDTDNPAARLKEAYACLLLAQDPTVREVVTGQQAVKLQYPRGEVGENADAIGFVTRTQVKIAEAKSRSELYKALFQQMPAAIKALLGSSLHVVGSVLVADRIDEFLYARGSSPNNPEWSPSLAARKAPREYSGFEQHKPKLSHQYVYLLPPGLSREIAPSGIAIRRVDAIENSDQTGPIRLYTHVAIPHFPSLPTVMGKDAKVPQWGPIKGMELPGALGAPVKIAMIKPVTARR